MSLIKNGNTVTINVASDMPVGSKYQLIASYGDFSKTLGINIVSEQTSHIHTYTSSITKEATCTEDGVKTYTCECGDTYIETISALGHNYEDGTCTKCGETDPDYVVEGKFINYSWEEIQEICNNGEANEVFNVGDYTTVEFAALSSAVNSPVAQTATVTIVDIADDGQSIIMMFTDYDTLAPTHDMNTPKTNSGGWVNTSMRSWLNSSNSGGFYASLPSDLKNVISVHSTSYTYNYYDTSVKYCNDKLWLPSGVEIGFTQTSDERAHINVDTKFQYFENNTFGSLIKNPSFCWLRTSDTSTLYCFNKLYSTDTLFNADNANFVYCAFPAFQIGNK